MHTWKTLLTVLLSAGLARAEQDVDCRPLSDSADECTIREPSVRSPLTTYPDVRLRPGDVYTITRAGGCVHIGGHSPSWRRYVDPSGPRSDALYYAVINMPGALGTRVRDILNTPLTIPSYAGPMVLSLGYYDDNYTDNDYSSHDDGPDRQCALERDGGAAYLVLQIEHHTPPDWLPQGYPNVDCVRTKDSVGPLVLCNIRANVQRPLTRYPDIKLQRGDIVTVSAQGCVNVSRDRRARFRYADPQPNSDPLHFGSISIPYATAGEQRFRPNGQGFTVGPLQTPQSAASPYSYPILYYKDTIYADNGYTSMDGGPLNQCVSQKAATVTLRIRHGGPALVAWRPLDVVPERFDLNALPLNPRFGAQLDAPDSESTDAFGLCHFGVNDDSDLSFEHQCTLQGLTYDYYKGSWGWAGVCSGLHGHVNWFPVTYEGYTRPDGNDHFEEDPDINIRLKRCDRRGLTTDTDTTGLEAEVNVYETLIGWRCTKADPLSGQNGRCIPIIRDWVQGWWRKFLSEMGNGRRSSSIDNHYAVMTGLFGLDCGHAGTLVGSDVRFPCATELHPLFATAIHINNSGVTNVNEIVNDPSHDRWAILVRNSGGEGYCSFNTHFLDLPDNRIYLRIPWWKGAQTVGVVSEEFHTSAEGFGGPAWCALPPGGTIPARCPILPGGPVPAEDEGLIVAFDLPPPEVQGVLLGEITLAWQGTSGPFMPSTGCVPAFENVALLPKKPSDTGEEAAGVGRFYKTLPPEKRRLVDAARAVKASIGPAFSPRAILNSAAGARRTQPTPTDLREPGKVMRVILKDS